MLNRRQCITLLMLNNRRWDKSNPIGWLPREVCAYIIGLYRLQDPNSAIAQALRLAASGEETDLASLVGMVKTNPRLLLQAGNVVTRGGLYVVRKTLYEFFLGEGDPLGAKLVEFGFAEIPDGEKERIRICKQYRPHIVALANQVTSDKPAFDLRPLFEVIIQSSPEDIKAALKRDKNHESKLNDAMCEFENAVSLKRKTDGMHYEHYPTLIQAFVLRHDRLVELQGHRQNKYYYSYNYDKCDLVWQQIIGRLQLNLPAPERFQFARAFEDEERTVKFKYGNRGSFPDTSDLVSGVGVNEAIFGEPLTTGRDIMRSCYYGMGLKWDLKKYMEKKILYLKTLVKQTTEELEEEQSMQSTCVIT